MIHLETWDDPTRSCTAGGRMLKAFKAHICHSVWLLWEQDELEKQLQWPDITLICSALKATVEMWRVDDGAQRLISEQQKQALLYSLACTAAPQSRCSLIFTARKMKSRGQVNRNLNESWAQSSEAHRYAHLTQPLESLQKQKAGVCRPRHGATWALKMETKAENPPKTTFHIPEYRFNNRDTRVIWNVCRRFSFCTVTGLMLS